MTNTVSSNTNSNNRSSINHRTANRHLYHLNNTITSTTTTNRNVSNSHLVLCSPADNFNTINSSADLIINQQVNYSGSLSASSNSSNSSSSSTSSSNTSSLAFWPAMNQLLESTTADRLEQNSDKFNQTPYPDDTYKADCLNVKKILGPFQQARSLSPNLQINAAIATNLETSSFSESFSLNDGLLNTKPNSVQVTKQRNRNDSSVYTNRASLPLAHNSSLPNRSNPANSSNSSRFTADPNLMNRSITNNTSNNKTNNDNKSPPINKLKKEASMTPQLTKPKENFNLNDVFKVFIHFFLLQKFNL